MEVGPLKIVEGMRAAIRCLKTSKMSRKDIATFSGVTPPLVKYYFPDRDVLLEAAALPVVAKFAKDIMEVIQHVAPRETVLQIIIITILNHRMKNGALIDAYVDYISARVKRIPNPLDDSNNAIVEFFGKWLAELDIVDLDAVIMQITLTGMCEIVSRGNGVDLEEGTRLVYRLISHAMGVRTTGDAVLIREALSGRGQDNFKRLLKPKLETQGGPQSPGATA